MKTMVKEIGKTIIHFYSSEKFILLQYKRLFENDEFPSFQRASDIEFLFRGEAEKMPVKNIKRQAIEILQEKTVFVKSCNHSS